MSIKKTLLLPKPECNNLRFFDVIHNFISGANNSNDKLYTEVIKAFTILKKGILNGEITADNLANLQKILTGYLHIFHDSKTKLLLQDIIASKPL